MLRSNILAIEDFKWLFVSEIKGIQDYILGTDKLKHIIGASEIVSNITKKIYHNVLNDLGCLEGTDYEVMQEAAGRLILLFNKKENMDKLLAVWGIIINEYAPGAELVYNGFQMDTSNLYNERENALKKMRLQRQQPSCSLPIPSLLVERCRRDGKAAVKLNPQDSKEPISNEIDKKLEAAKNSRKDLLKMFIPESDSNHSYSHLESEELWPQDFKDLTDSNDQNYMAVMHIDVNKMGLFFIELGNNLKNADPNKFLEVNKLVSEKLLDSIKYAAQQATKSILDEMESKEGIYVGKTDDYNRIPLMPMRPIVLAGDDLTLVIKAPYAIRFAESYMNNFSSRAKKELLQIINTYKLNINTGLTDLTLSAGITFTKAKFPFKVAYNLCEELCKLGKKMSQRSVSTISFYRQTTSTCDDLENLLDREFKHNDGTTVLDLSYRTYALSNNENRLPLIADLKRIVTNFCNLPQGALRKMATKLFDNKIIVDSAWERFVDICSDRRSHELEKLLGNMKSITKNSTQQLWENYTNNVYRTPLVDAINLYSVTADYYKEN